MIQPGMMCIVTRALWAGKERFLGHIVTVSKQVVATKNALDPEPVPAWLTEPIIRWPNRIDGVVAFSPDELTPIPPLNEDIHETDTIDVPA